MAQHVNKYQVSATFQDRLVSWKFVVETDDGARHEFALRDGEEVPILLDLCRHDDSLFFDKATQTLSTGMNDPGDDD
ncbi:MAG: hypothetical protein U1D55_05060 [Phycisphaerae bacterium]